MVNLVLLLLTLQVYQERARRWWCIHLVTDPAYYGRGFARMIIDKAREEVSVPIPVTCSYILTCFAGTEDAWWFPGANDKS